MYSIKELFKVGNGPSSSHTIGPLKASKEFIKRYPDCDLIEVTLYGSLALTGKGHLTDYIVEKGLSPIPNKIIWRGLCLRQNNFTLALQASLTATL